MRSPFVAAYRVPPGLEYAGDLRECPLSVRHVIEHVVCDHGVESLALERQFLYVRNQELEASTGPEASFGLGHHPGRSVGQRDRPSCGEEIQVPGPQDAGAATDLQYGGLVRKLEVVEDPTRKAVGVGAEAFVQRDAGFEVRGVAVLPRYVFRVRVRHALPPVGYSAASGGPRHLWC